MPLSARVSEAFQRVIDEYQPASLVFYGATLDTPMSKSTIEDHLYMALERIGIVEAERRQRRITFHSHRHFLNTLLRSAGVADSKVRQITGHRSEAMSNLYTHYRHQDFLEVVEVQGRLLELPVGKVQAAMGFNPPQGGEKDG